MQAASPRPQVRPPGEREAWSWGRFAEGFVRMLPLWAAAVPVGIAFGLAARNAEVHWFETVLMSLTVFSAAAQLSAVSLMDQGAPAIVLVGTAVALNAQLLFIGLAIGRRLRATRAMRLVTAYFLTDAAYAVALAGGALSLATITGAGASMFVAWNAGTVIGAVAGEAIPHPRWLALDLLAPLTFLAVLVPLVRTRATLLAAVVAGVVAVALAPFAPGGTTLLGAALAGSIAGAWWDRAGDAGDRAGRTEGV